MPIVAVRDDAAILRHRYAKIIREFNNQRGWYRVRRKVSLRKERARKRAEKVYLLMSIVHLVTVIYSRRSKDPAAEENAVMVFTFLTFYSFGDVLVSLEETWRERPFQYRF